MGAGEGTTSAPSSFFSGEKSFPHWSNKYEKLQLLGKGRMEKQLFSPNKTKRYPQQPLCCGNWEQYIFSFAPHHRQRSGILGSNSFRPRGESQEGGRSPLPGRFKGIGFLREGENRNSPSLKRVFSPFLHAQKWGYRPGLHKPGRNIFASASKRKRNGGRDSDF